MYIYNEYWLHVTHLEVTYEFKKRLLFTDIMSSAISLKILFILHNSKYLIILSDKVELQSELFMICYKLKMKFH